MDVSESVILDIESHNMSSGSPQITRILSRKGSSRMERRNAEEQEGEDSSKKLVVKVVCSQVEHLKQSFICNKAASPTSAGGNSISHSDTGEGKIKRLNRLTTVNPKRILLLFASMSSMGTLILIYFTLSIYRRGA